MVLSSAVSRVGSSVRWMVALISMAFLPGRLGCSVGIRMPPGLG
nr:MAG TPA: hypothetical protein [Caudoviricetes sp.]